MNIRAPASDIAKLRQFYCEIVGLEDGWRPPFKSRGHWLYAGPHPLVHLVEDNEKSGLASGGGVDHVAFQCSDLAPLIERLRSKGIEFQLTQVPSLGPPLDNWQLLVRDPLGIGVEFSVSEQPC